MTMERRAAPRRRLVNFRLTEEEYQRLRLAAEAEGSRGISDFARARLLGGTEPMGERMGQFESALLRLSAAVTALGGSMGLEAAGIPEEALYISDKER